MAFTLGFILGLVLGMLIAAFGILFLPDIIKSLLKQPKDTDDPKQVRILQFPKGGFAASFQRGPENRLYFDEFWTLELSKGDFLGEFGIGVFDVALDKKGPQIVEFSLFDKWNITTPTVLVTVPECDTSSLSLDQDITQTLILTQDQTEIEFNIWHEQPPYGVTMLVVVTDITYYDDGSFQSMHVGLNPAFIAPPLNS